MNDFTVPGAIPLSKGDGKNLACTIKSPPGLSRKPDLRFPVAVLLRSAIRKGKQQNPPSIQVIPQIACNYTAIFRRTHVLFITARLSRNLLRQFSGHHGAAHLRQDRGYPDGLP